MNNNKKILGKVIYVITLLFLLVIDVVVFSKLVFTLLVVD